MYAKYAAHEYDICICIIWYINFSGVFKKIKVTEYAQNFSAILSFDGYVHENKVDFAWK